MHAIRPDADATAALPLFGTRSTRQLEQQAQLGLPPHRLMQRAGEAVYRLGSALYPHAQRIWVACGNGNNGGDGLVAAAHWQRKLHPWGGSVTVSWSGPEGLPPDDAAWALQLARQSGVLFSDQPPTDMDLAIDAVFGIGLNRPPEGRGAEWIETLTATSAPVVCVDVPSGLHADTGHWFGPGTPVPNGPRHTLSLLTLKPGLYTGHGRTVSGDIWLDDLGLTAWAAAPPDAWLHTRCATRPSRQQQHHSHKGSHGEVLVIGGQNASRQRPGMTGAALLAARAALRHGAGRVYVGLLSSRHRPEALSVDTQCPELMFRSVATLAHNDLLSSAVTVCGCGGGVAVRQWMPTLLQHSPALVLDADALNAISESTELQALTRQRHARRQWTVMTPHPLEAARLLGATTHTVQADRLQAARSLAEQYQCTVALKGSGTVLAAPGLTPRINPTGNGLLATAGTGDVLAGMIGAALAPLRSLDAEGVLHATADAVHRHGQIADRWPASHHGLTASDLIAQLSGG